MRLFRVKSSELRELREDLYRRAEWNPDSKLSPEAQIRAAISLSLDRLLDSLGIGVEYDED